MSEKAKEYLSLVEAKDASKRANRGPWVLQNGLYGRLPHGRKLAIGHGVKMYSFGSGSHSMAGKHGLIHPDGTPCDATKPENCPIFNHSEREAKVDVIEPPEKITFERTKVRKLEPEEREAVAKDLEPLMERYNAIASRCRKAKSILSETNGRLKFADRETAEKLNKAKKLAKDFLAEHRAEAALLKNSIFEVVKEHRCRILAVNMTEFGELTMDALRVGNGTTVVLRNKKNNLIRV